MLYDPLTLASHEVSKISTRNKVSKNSHLRRPITSNYPSYTLGTTFLWIGYPNRLIERNDFFSAHNFEMRSKKVSPEEIHGIWADIHCGGQSWSFTPPTITQWLMGAKFSPCFVRIETYAEANATQSHQICMLLVIWGFATLNNKSETFFPFPRFQSSIRWSIMNVHFCVVDAHHNMGLSQFQKGNFTAQPHMSQ